jgi:hypothetical protein
MSSVKEVIQNEDVDESLEKDILLRKSRLLYPEAEDWVLNLAIEIYLKQKGVDSNQGELNEMPEIN